jgi:hypothetical protein
MEPFVGPGKSQLDMQLLDSILPTNFKVIVTLAEIGRQNQINR